MSPTLAPSSSISQEPCLKRLNEGRVVTLRLNRPGKLNALNVDVFKQLDAEIVDLETDRNVDVVVIRGEGRCFSAGHDLQDLESGEELPYPNYQGLVIERLANLPQLVICVVHGHCYTGALELALAADLILASESARFADTHAKWGLTPIWGMSQRLPRRVGAYLMKPVSKASEEFPDVGHQSLGFFHRREVPADLESRILLEVVVSLGPFARHVRHVVLEVGQRRR
jgi:enoyl-CoA hydratase/carnithine racemase